MMQELEQLRKEYAKFKSIELVDYFEPLFESKQQKGGIYLVSEDEQKKRGCTKLLYKRRFFLKEAASAAEEFILAMDLSTTCAKDRICFFDIETDDRAGKPVIGQARVVSVAAVDNAGNEFFFCLDDERALLLKLKKLFEDYDLIVGWYSAEFDFPVLIARGEKHGVSFKDEDRKHLDFFKSIDKIYNIKQVMNAANLKDFSLGTVGERFLGLKKIEDERGAYGGRVYSLFERDRLALRKYNVRDCEILRGLEGEFEVIKTFKLIAEFARVPLAKLHISLNPAIECLILKYILEKSADKRDFDFRQMKLMKYVDVIKESAYKGAYIYLLKAGMFDNVIIVDFWAMYPNIIRTFNISFDTIVEKEEGIVGQAVLALAAATYSREYQGIMSMISEDLLAKRIEYKRLELKSQETILKLISNSLYGYFGSKYSRFKNVKVAESITEVARVLMQALIEHYEKTDTFVIYSHTDSAAICNVPKEKCASFSAELNVLVKKILKEKFGIEEDKNYLELKFVMHMTKAMWEAKGRYVGHVDVEGDKEVDKLYFKGIELNRTDFNIFTKEVALELLNKLFAGDSVDDIKRFLFAQKKLLYDFQISLEKIAFTQKIGMMEDDYTNIPLQAQIALEEAKAEGKSYFVSKRVSYILTGRKKRLQGVSLEKAKREGIKYSADLHWARAFLAFERFLELAFPLENFDDVKNETKIIKQLRLV